MHHGRVARFWHDIVPGVQALPDVLRHAFFLAMLLTLRMQTKSCRSLNGLSPVRPTGCSRSAPVLACVARERGLHMLRAQERTSGTGGATAHRRHAAGQAEGHARGILRSSFRQT